MRYWRLVAQRAWSETRKTLKIETAKHIIILVLSQSMIAIVLIYETGDASAWTRIGSAIAPFLLFPGVFIYEFIVSPPKLHKELEARLTEIEVAGDNFTKVKNIREQIAEFLRQGQELDKLICKGSDALTEQVEAWAKEVYLFLNDNLDKYYTVRFVSEAGFMSLVVTGPYSQEQKKNILWLERRVERLQQFLPEIR